MQLQLLPLREEPEELELEPGLRLQLPLEHLHPQLRRHPPLHLPQQPQRQHPSHEDESEALALIRKLPTGHACPTPHFEFTRRGLLFNALDLSNDTVK